MGSMVCNETICNNVCELRKKRNIRQEDLAEAVGCTRQTIISIEKGNYIPSVLLALKISNFFNKPLKEIFQIQDKDNEVNTNS
jgi:putative transcriptional regulator